MKIFEGDMFIRSQTITLLQIFSESMLYFKVIFKTESSGRYLLEKLSINGLRSIIPISLNNIKLTTATWAFQHKSSFLCISEISEVDY